MWFVSLGAMPARQVRLIVRDRETGMWLVQDVVVTHDSVGFNFYAVPDNLLTDKEYALRMLTR